MSGNPRAARPSATGSTWSRLRFLVTPRWIALEIAVIAFALACYFLLAPWQFSRSATHSSQQQEITAALHEPTVPVSRVMSTTKQPADHDQWRAVSVTGHFEPGSNAYIRLRHDNDGRPAYEVVTGFVTDHGPRLLVDRGYVSYIEIQEGGTAPPPPTGTVTVTGRVQQDQTDPKHRPPSRTPDGHDAYTAVNSSILASQTVYRGYIQLIGDSPGVLDPIALPEDNSRPFFSYAIQWLSFGAIAIIGLGYFIYREYVDPVDADSIYLDEDTTDASATAEAGSSSGPGDHGADDHLASEAARGPTTRRARRSRRFDKQELYDP